MIRLLQLLVHCYLQKLVETLKKLCEKMKNIRVLTCTKGEATITGTVIKDIQDRNPLYRKTTNTDGITKYITEIIGNVAEAEVEEDVPKVQEMTEAMITLENICHIVPGLNLLEGEIALAVPVQGLDSAHVLVFVRIWHIVMKGPRRLINQKTQT